MAKDNFSGYVFLRACDGATAKNAADLLLEYFSSTHLFQF